MVKLTDIAKNHVLADRIWDSFDDYWCNEGLEDICENEDERDEDSEDEDRQIDTFGFDSLFDRYDNDNEFEGE